MLTHIRTETDLDMALAALTAADPRFAALIARAGRPPLRRRPDGFAGLVATVVSQQLSIRWSRRRLCVRGRCGSPASAYRRRKFAHSRRSHGRSRVAAWRWRRSL